MNCKINICMLLLFTLLLGSCTTSNQTNKMMIGIAGAAVGGLVGGWAGSRLGAELGRAKTFLTVVGASGGVMVGYNVARRINVADYGDYNQAITSAMNGSGQSTWTNRITGNGGLIRAQNEYLSSLGEQCRIYRSTVTFSDEIISGNGTACRKEETNEWILVADAFY